MITGIYTNISNAEYHASEGISKTGLDTILSKSLKHYKYEKDHPEERKESASMQLGSLVHKLLLEPDDFYNEYSLPFVEPANCIKTVDQMKVILKEYGLPVSGKRADLQEQLRAIGGQYEFYDDLYAQYLEQNAGKTIISQELIDTAEKMRDAVLNDQFAGNLFKDDVQAVNEASFYLKDDDRGITMRCRPDRWRTDGIVIDLKTITSADPDTWSKHVQNYRYHMSAAFYTYVMNEVLNDYEEHGVLDYENFQLPETFVFVCVESAAPFDVACYMVDSESLSIGFAEMQEGMQKYYNAVKTGKWPGHGAELKVLGLPDWRLRREQNRG